MRHTRWIRQRRLRRKVLPELVMVWRCLLVQYASITLRICRSSS
jgi:hypothetical protein